MHRMTVGNSREFPLNWPTLARSAHGFDIVGDAGVTNLRQI